MEVENQQLWKTVLGQLELNLSKPSFATWFKDTLILDKSDDKITIGVPNGFSKEWLKNKYHENIINAVKSVCPEVREIHYEISTTSNKNKQVKNTTSYEPAVSLPSNSNSVGGNGLVSTVNGLNPKYTFSNFIVGGSNELAAAACMAVAKKPGVSYNPLFLYGGVGLGKTHLMQAIGNEVLQKNPSARVLYVTSEKFTNEFISSVEKGKMAAFKDLYRNVDVLFVDDIQFIAGKERSQEEFFHTFNSLHQNNKQIVISSDRLPKEIPTIEERLVSRFEQGMIADVQLPDFETRLAILKTKSKEKDYSIDIKVLEVIAEVVKSNIRELEGSLNRLMVYCQLNNISPSVEHARIVLASTAPKKKNVSMKKISDSVSSFYNVTPNDLIRQSRKKEFVKPRQIAMYIIRSEIESSFPSIGDYFGGRDHTTVMHAVDKITKLIKEKDSLRQEVDIILEKIYV